MGYYALKNSAANHNTAFGSEALVANTGGARNTAVGSDALTANTGGTQNVAVGNNAGLYIDTGSQNTCLGVDSARRLVSGSNNTFIGFEAGKLGPTGATGAATSNSVVLGNIGITFAYCQVAFSSASDRRIKKDIEVIDWSASDYINKIQPVSYRLKNEHDCCVKRVGFIAQELKDIEDEMGLTDVCVDTSDDQLYKLKINSIVAVLVNAVKELGAKIETLESNTSK